ncbi:MAG: hypothetical protein IKE58_02145 [Blautia sp.]|nr:hypothetical protein [Blautia sp.]
MKKRAILSVCLSILCTVSALLTGCGGPVKEPAQTILTTVTPTETPDAPTATPTPVPNLIGTTYRSPDGTFTIEVPDEGWRIKAEDTNLASFELANVGTIRILHGQGEGAMSAVVIPDTYDLAVSLEQAAGLDAGIDFEIPDYSADAVGNAYIYDYTVHYMDAIKSDGKHYTVNRYLVSDNEYYSLLGTVMDENSLAEIRKSLESFHILNGTALSDAAPGNEKQEAADTPVQTQTVGDDSVQSPSADVSQPSASYYAQDGSNYTEEQLWDTNQTRTIYRNSDGTPIVIVPDGYGGWNDSFGNSYYFVNDQDVYDQNDVDFYWHGEAGDVAFMPIE